MESTYSVRVYVVPHVNSTGPGDCSNAMRVTSTGQCLRGLDVYRIVSVSLILYRTCTGGNAESLLAVMRYS